MRTFAMLLTMLALTGFVLADDTDPEPPGKGGLQQLIGTWKSVRMTFKGMDRPSTMYTYTFAKDKVTYTIGTTKTVRSMKLKADKNRPGYIEMTPENSTTGTKWFFKIEKGELYLSPDRSNDPKAKPDFTGNNGPVMILKQEKK